MSQPESAPLLPPTPSEQPLSLHVREVSAPESFDGARCLRIEFSSRGDRIPGRLLVPSEGDGPFPVVLLQHGAGGSKEAPYMDTVAANWVRRGVAIASIDWPLHGERRSAKLSERLLLSLAVASGERGADSSLDGSSLTLVSEFARQSVCDLACCLDALAELPELDHERLIYAGFSLGSMLGALFCARDPRPRAAALALGGGGFEPAFLDPARYIGGLAPRPLLMVNASGDRRVPRAAAETLYKAAGEPKSIQWFEADHQELPGVALKAMWLFISEHLGLA